MNELTKFPYQKTISKLIAVGQDLARSSAPDLSSLKYCDRINRIGNKQCEAETSHLSNIELIYLIKGITFVERELKWIGGSVASAIWLFYILLKRDVSIEEIDEVSAWVLENTRNDYSPFGTTITLSAANYSEYQRRSNSRREAITLQLLRDGDVERDAKKQRFLRRQSRLLGVQQRKTAVRSDLIKRLNGMSVRDQLLLISKDDKHLPNFYPTKCAASSDITEIESLPEETRSILVNKMKGKYRGPWGKFKQRLLSVSPHTHNREPWDI